jgi:TPR repeat protein
MKDADKKKEQRADELLNKGAALYQKHQYAEAMTYYQQAAELGSVTAMSNLGYCYYYGRSVPVDYQQAAHYFQQGPPLRAMPIPCTN